MIRISVITSLYNCAKYLSGYFNAVEKIINKEECEFLLLHNKPTDEELSIIKESIYNRPHFKHIVIPERESLYSTWNRGIKIANGEYCAVWNVDDIRVPNSLFMQAKTLDENPDAAMTYGDVILNTEYGNKEGRFVHSPVYHKKKYDFLRSHHINCFPMWRTEIHEKVGYFDEQFLLVSDFEFQIRVGRAIPFVKTEAMIGYFLISAPLQLSSNRKLQSTELNTVLIRYGIFDKLNLLFAIAALKKYSIFNFICYNKKYAVSDWFSNYTFFIILRMPLFIISVLLLPYHILYAIGRWLKNKWF